MGRISSRTTNATRGKKRYEKRVQKKRLHPGEWRECISRKCRCIASVIFARRARKKMAPRKLGKSNIFSYFFLSFIRYTTHPKLESKYGSSRTRITFFSIKHSLVQGARIDVKFFFDRKLCRNCEES